MSLILNSPATKEILARVRGADFAHAGELEALEICAEVLSPIRGRAALDVGCGRGGSAAWLAQRGASIVTGIDIDDDSISYAKKTYPNVSFRCADVLDLGSYIKTKFDLCWMINSFYSFPEQQAALEAIRQVTSENGELLIFDYTRPDQNIPTELGENIGSPMILSEAEQWLRSSGWQISAVRDLSSQYTHWYHDFVERFRNMRELLVECYDEHVVDAITDWYAKLHSLLKARLLGGVVLVASAT